ncbi:TetR/AcrR family transcriptional regulator [Rhizobium sp. AG855]|uniref:TetR/AcrR family transcriptional regulator n=1 Tax=Rhizobium sp. AG855 TaxID=2183898 RepID=UPI0016000F99|nr:TetR/AcrR family transcriptional regulator [Rhizobium sp. AG855]
MSEISVGERRALILQAAYGTFVSYGFKRTTMDDIAQVVGLSRPALYIHFRNKPDIFRALMRSMMEEALLKVRSSLEQDLPLEDRLFLALSEGIVAPQRQILATAHGAELFDTSHEFGADLFLDWMKAVEEEIARELSRSEAARVITFPSGLSSEIVASLLIDAVEGMKCRRQDIEELDDTIPHLLKLVLGAIQPR